MTKRSRREWPEYDPSEVRFTHGPGDKGHADPFYLFKQIARDDGKPYKSPEPKAERDLLALLGTNAAVVVMSCVLVVVVVTLLVLLVVRP
jgi:hypothetical protein